MHTFHHDCLVVDAHVDTALAVWRGRSLGRRAAVGHVDLPRLAQGGVNVQVFAHFIEPEYKPERSLPRFLELLDAFLTAVDENAERIAVVTSMGAAAAAVAQGKVAAVLAIEGGEALAGRLAVLRVFYRLGVRLIGLTWNERNDLAVGAGAAGAGGGLTRLGTAVVAEMNRLGMVVDVSHLSDQSFWHVLAVSRQPVVASHSNCRALCNHPRNLTDRQIKALARQGGVMGMNFYPPFVDPAQATVERVVDHIDHVLQLVGPDHVGLGSDFDGIDETPIGLEDVTRLPSLTEAMFQRGWDESTMAKILGGNFSRVFRHVWGG